jgi:hypothetical protein
MFAQPVVVGGYAAMMPAGPCLLAQPPTNLIANPLRMDAVPTAFGGVIGSIWLLSQDPQGCRRVQDVIENGSDSHRDAIARELFGHVVEALQHPHANFVLRKCVEKLPPQAVQFVIDELLAGGTAIAEAARHRYGCRILEALYEHCPPSQLSQVTELFLTDCANLCCHMYGNFVMQRILQHGTTEQRNEILKVICTQAATLGSNFYASTVVGTALRTCSDEDRPRIANALAVADVLPAIAKFKHGNDIVEVVMQHLDSERQQAANAQLSAAAALREKHAADMAAQQAAHVDVQKQRRRQRKHVNE